MNDPHFFTSLEVKLIFLVVLSMLASIIMALAIGLIMPQHWTSDDFVADSEQPEVDCQCDSRVTQDINETSVEPVARDIVGDGVTLMMDKRKADLIMEGNKNIVFSTRSVQKSTKGKSSHVKANNSHGSGRKHAKKIEPITTEVTTEKVVLMETSTKHTKHTTRIKKKSTKKIHKETRVSSTNSTTKPTTSSTTKSTTRSTNRPTTSSSKLKTEARKKHTKNDNDEYETKTKIVYTPKMTVSKSSSDSTVTDYSKIASTCSSISEQFTTFSTTVEVFSYYESTTEKNNVKDSKSDLNIKHEIEERKTYRNKGVRSRKCSKSFKIGKKINDYPFLTSLTIPRYSDEPTERMLVCTGSVITKKYILSGGKCLKEVVEWPNLEARVGSEHWSSGGFVYSIRQLVSYSVYGTILLELDDSFVFGGSVNPVRLGQSSWMAAVTVGWSPSDRLLKNRFTTDVWLKYDCGNCSAACCSAGGCERGTDGKPVIFRDLLIGLSCKEVDGIYPSMMEVEEKEHVFPGLGGWPESKKAWRIIEVKNVEDVCIPYAVLGEEEVDDGSVMF